MEGVMTTDVQERILTSHDGDVSKVTLDEYAEIMESYKGFNEVNEYGRFFAGPNYPEPCPCWNTAVTRDSIKHMVDALGDLNPLYRNKEYAAKTKYNSLIAPPCWPFSITYGCYPPFGVPQLFGLYSSDKLEWYRPVAAGTDIDYRSTFPVEVLRKSTKKGGEAVRVQGRNEFKTANGGIPLCTHDFHIMFIEIKKAGWKDTQSGADMPEYTEEYIEKVHAAQDNEKVWGSTPHYWEDVTVGETITPIVRGPMSAMEFATWWTACGQWYMCSDRIGRFIHEQTGWGYYHPRLKTWLNFHENVYDAFGVLHEQTGSYLPSGAGSQRAAWAMTALSNWVGDEGFVWKMDTRHLRKGGYWNVFWTGGTVTAKGVDEARRSWVELKMEVKDQRDEIILGGTATVLLPSRERGPVIYPNPTYAFDNF